MNHPEKVALSVGWPAHPKAYILWSTSVLYVLLHLWLEKLQEKNSKLELGPTLANFWLWKWKRLTNGPSRTSVSGRNRATVSSKVKAASVCVRLQFGGGADQATGLTFHSAKKRKNVLLQLQEICWKKYMMQIIWQTVGEWGMFRCAVHQDEFTTFGNENGSSPLHFLEEGSYINSEVEGRKSRGLAVGLALKSPLSQCRVRCGQVIRPWISKAFLALDIVQQVRPWLSNMQIPCSPALHLFSLHFWLLLGL